MRDTSINLTREEIIKLFLDDGWVLSAQGEQTKIHVDGYIFHMSRYFREANGRGVQMQVTEGIRNQSSQSTMTIRFYFDVSDFLNENWFKQLKFKCKP